MLKDTNPAVSSLAKSYKMYCADEWVSDSEYQDEAHSKMYNDEADEKAETMWRRKSAAMEGIKAARSSAMSQADDPMYYSLLNAAIKQAANQNGHRSISWMEQNDASDGADPAVRDELLAAAPSSSSFLSIPSTPSVSSTVRSSTHRPTWRCPMPWRTDEATTAIRALERFGNLSDGARHRCDPPIGMVIRPSTVTAKLGDFIIKNGYEDHVHKDILMQMIREHQAANADPDASRAPVPWQWRSKEVLESEIYFKSLRKRKVADAACEIGWK